jgi:hypothetical protein
MKNKDEKSIDQMEVVKEKAAGMELMTSEFQVTNDQEYDSAADRIKQIKTLQKFVETEKDKFVAPAKAIIAEAKEKYDVYIKKCQNAADMIKSKALAYYIDKEKKRLADEASIAKKVESGYMKPETAMKKMETLPEVPKTVRTDTGSGLRMSKRKVAKITDPNLIPDEYWVIDEIRVRKEALEREKNGLPQIPGVVIQEEASLSSI